MSLASTLLRVVLMLSLLLNGLNAAMASGHEEMGRMAHAVAAAVDGGDPDCQHHAAMQADEAPQAKAPAHDAHCQIKDCVRSCAQHPLLVVQPLPFMAGPALSLAPQPMPATGRPSPPLPPISRPPIG
ncbi:TPA: CopL family metal-binding regulatory protein [Stenotrophomonas maltophilia]|uniref:CopL family metal-binding regulatory protein n=1 Tax=Stenotrophomonas TaxID=40323 RepID=UPI000DA9A41A|nr:MULTISPECIES: CopL family metal-binding regulatory protein [Stenotrophomonas]EKT4070303.1 CopL family metal-binding regulatory protein [Stenotrophomonas maltophilia]EKT4079160.1 CopL family metal-binding regulatory protein [Stenotrophomonas maltophilia]MBH1623902.1 CopL family metal-binding regulatory protein [Stenotrophomonas maltophilia]MDQ7308432.1 CopL family metal-binding regulatory protein [Stenotrophomonas sp. Sm3119]PZS55586.1 CopY family transcriptional regulator [Stenotrophomonas 